MLIDSTLVCLSVQLRRLQYGMVSPNTQAVRYVCVTGQIDSQSVGQSGFWRRTRPTESNGPPGVRNEIWTKRGAYNLELAEADLEEGGQAEAEFHTHRYAATQ